ncbi:MAG: hypothetical protein QXL15_03475 [Candidatus Korarchaeota archaeon]
MDRQSSFISTIDWALGGVGGATIILDSLGYEEFAGSIRNAVVLDGMSLLRNNEQKLLDEIGKARKIALWLTRPVPPSKTRKLMSLVLSRKDKIPVAVGIRIPEKIPSPDETNKMCKDLAFKLSLLVNGGHEITIITALGNRLSVRPVAGTLEYDHVAEPGKPSALPPGRVSFKVKSVVGKILVDHGAIPFSCADLWLSPITEKIVLSLDGTSCTVENHNEVAAHIRDLTVTEFGFGCANLDEKERHSTLMELCSGTAHVIFGESNFMNIIPEGALRRVSFGFKITSFRG